MTETPHTPVPDEQPETSPDVDPGQLPDTPVVPEETEEEDAHGNQRPDQSGR